MVNGPSLNGMDVSEAVGVMLGVKVFVGKSVMVGVLVRVGVNVMVAVRVKVGVDVSVTVGVELMKYPRTAEFEDSSQAPMTRNPRTRLNTQKPVTILPSDLDDEPGISPPFVRCDAGYRGPC